MCRVKLGIVHVNVHVPEAGDQEFLGSVDYPRVRRNLDLRSGPQPRNTPAGNNYGHLQLRRRTGRVDHRDVSQGERNIIGLGRLDASSLCNDKPARHH